MNLLQKEMNFFFFLINLIYLTQFMMIFNLHKMALSVKDVLSKFEEIRVYGNKL